MRRRKRFSPPPCPTKPSPPDMTETKSSLTLRRFQSLFALALMVAALAMLSDKFLTFDNGWNILRQISVNLCLSIGMTLVILSRRNRFVRRRNPRTRRRDRGGAVEKRADARGVWRATGIHDGWRDRRWPRGWSGGRLVQRLRDHAISAASIRRHARHAQHRPRADDAVDGRVSPHVARIKFRLSGHGGVSRHADAGLDHGRAHRALRGRDPAHAVWAAHLRRRRQRARRTAHAASRCTDQDRGLYPRGRARRRGRA